MLVREDNIPNFQWPLGLIVEIFPSKDGRIRSVKVETNKGIIVRPVQKLHDLEIHSCPDLKTHAAIDNKDSVTNINSNDKNSVGNKDELKLDVKSRTVDLSDELSMRTRFGRTIRKPERLDL